MVKFDVTYEIVTEESAEDGEAAEDGFVSQGVGLRDAIADVTDTASCYSSQSGIEANCSGDAGQASWFTVYNGMDYINGNYENRSLHIPDGVTASSRRRIARLMGVRV